MAEIPQELITEILLLSRVKSLLRFRCLSKSLRTLVDSLDFINWHLNKSSENINHGKLIFQDISGRFHVCNMSECVEEEAQLKPLYSWPDYVYGYCNGLLLLYLGCSELALWNPSTRQCNKLLDCPSSLRFHGKTRSGLGYDSIDGYKAMLILCLGLQVEAWIFRVRSNTWRRIQDFSYAKFCGFRDFMNENIGIFADGGIYWLVPTVTGQPPYEILAFDLRKETFSLEPISVCSIPSNQVIISMHVLEGRLCISCINCSKLQADFYVRNKDQFSWTQLYSIKEPGFLSISCFRNVRVLGYFKNKDNILLDFGMEEMVSYDIKKKSLGKVDLKRNPLWVQPILCIESLVSVRCGAHIDVSK